MDRVTAIRTSLKAFVWGIAGLIPFLVLAAAPVLLGVRVSFQDSQEPDPAQQPLRVVIGLCLGLASVASIAALIYWWRIRSRFAGQWNPASAYLDAGVWMAWLSLGFSLLIAGVMVVTNP